MIDRDEFLRALASSDLDDLIRRLVLFAHKECGADPAVVYRAIEEALEGEHQELWAPDLSHFAFLALVIDKIA